MKGVFQLGPHRLVVHCETVVRDHPALDSFALTTYLQFEGDWGYQAHKNFSYLFPVDALIFVPDPHIATCVREINLQVKHYENFIMQYRSPLPPVSADGSFNLSNVIPRPLSGAGSTAL